MSRRGARHIALTLLRRSSLNSRATIAWTRPLAFARETSAFPDDRYGTSTEPGLRVAPAVVRAAAIVHDGELVPSPVREDDSWAVVWRRGSVAAVRRFDSRCGAVDSRGRWTAILKARPDELVWSLERPNSADEGHGPPRCLAFPRPNAFSADSHTSPPAPPSLAASLRPSLVFFPFAARHAPSMTTSTTKTAS